jgi:hypothetical protein
VGEVEVPDLTCAAQGAEVEDRHPRSVRRQRFWHLLVRDIGRDQLKALVLIYQRAEAAADQILKSG